MTMRILIFTNIRLYAEGLTRIMHDEPGVNVVGTTSDVTSALKVIPLLRPAVVLVDLAMSGSIDAIKRLTAEGEHPRVVALTASETDSEIIACAEAGAVGYVTRESSLRDLLLCLKAVSTDELRCSPKIAASLMRRVSTLARAERSDTMPAGLTPRELQILKLLPKTNKEIARVLNIELATVKNHVHHILAKLEVRSRSEAVSLFHKLWTRHVDDVGMNSLSIID